MSGESIPDFSRASSRPAAIAQDVSGGNRHRPLKLRRRETPAFPVVTGHPLTRHLET